LRNERIVTAKILDALFLDMLPAKQALGKEQEVSVVRSRKVWGKRSKKGVLGYGQIQIGEWFPGGKTPTKRNGLEKGRGEAMVATPFASRDVSGRGN